MVKVTTLTKSSNFGVWRANTRANTTEYPLVYLRTTVHIWAKVVSELGWGVCKDVRDDRLAQKLSPDDDISHWQVKVPVTMLKILGNPSYRTSTSNFSTRFSNDSCCIWIEPRAHIATEGRRQGVSGSVSVFGEAYARSRGAIPWHTESVRDEI